MKINFQLEATIKQLSSLCNAVEALQQSIMCSDRQMFEITLVIEELCANIVNHGCATRMEIDLDKEWEELVITIKDDGSPFDPTLMPEVDIKTPLEERCPGGLGLHLVHHYVDSFEYRRENNSNIVTLKKNI